MASAPSAGACGPALAQTDIALSGRHQVAVARGRTAERALDDVKPSTTSAFPDQVATASA